MPSVDIVYNPNAGRGRAANLAAAVAAALGEIGYIAALFTIAEYLGDGEHQGGLFKRPRADRIVTLGGDGTVRAVVEALIARFNHQSPPVAVLAMGTANLVARHLRLPWRDETGLGQLVNAIASGATVEMDVPTANGQPFLVMCSVGFDAQVVHEVALRRSGPIRKVNYLPALARSIVGFRSDPIEVIVDGERLFGPGPAMVVVANAPEYGTGFSMNPNATSGDGLLDVTVFNMRSHVHLAYTALHAVTRRIARGAAIMTTGHEVEIRGGSAPAQIDGEAFGSTPIRIGLLRHRQRFIVAG